MMSARDEAIEIAEAGICSACSAIGCNSQDECDGFKKEVETILLEMACDDAVSG